MAAETPGHTLDATALVHEAYLRLVGDQQWSNSPRTADSLWAYARAWLLVQLDPSA